MTFLLLFGFASPAIADTTCVKLSESVEVIYGRYGNNVTLYCNFPGYCNRIFWRFCSTVLKSWNCSDCEKDNHYLIWNEKSEDDVSQHFIQILNVTDDVTGLYECACQYSHPNLTSVTNSIACYNLMKYPMCELEFVVNEKTRVMFLRMVCVILHTIGYICIHS